jgi:20S proteasome alpha/beta subunit
VGGSSGPQVRFGGAPVMVGSLGPWLAIGAEKTANGYEVAWKAGSADQYTVWNLDSNGNFLSDTIGVVSGTSYALESLEQSFQQDLNGDNQIGPPTTLIESFGATSLLQAAGTYVMYPVGGSSGPQVRIGGAPVMIGSLGPWLAIGAEKTAGGYEVAWKAGSADQYTVWNLDSSGNFLSDTIGVVSGASFALESLEPLFQQDLNGDNRIGPVTTLIESFGATSLLQAAGTYVMSPVGGSSGPQVRIGGTPVMVGSLGPWLAIGAEKTANGYEVAWKAGSANQYTVWFLDNNGNYLSDIGVVSGTSYALESLEPSFQQDLNGDNMIGPITTVIEAQGLTKFEQIADAYVMFPNNGANGVVLQSGGSQVVAGSLGTWVPFAAEQVAGGFEVAWKMTNADQYTTWLVDAAGNYITNTTPTTRNSGAMTALEPVFHQDLDGNNVIATQSVIEAVGSTSLSQVGNAYLIGGAFPVPLMLNGSPVTVGQFGAWTPIAAEASGGGYLVAWKQTSTNQYQVWSTDNVGNETGIVVGVVNANSLALESIEPTFQQDLNGDGVIDVPQIKINLVYDAQALAAPQSFRDAMQAAANILMSAFQDPITVNIGIGYGEIGGAALPTQSGAEGGPTSSFSYSYTALRNALANDERSADDITAVNALPATSSIQGISSFNLGGAEAKALGLTPGNGTAMDGHIGVGTNVPTNDLIAVALHEITHAMGRLTGTNSVLDLFRFDENNSSSREFSSATPAPPAYFSLNGGSQKLADFGITSDPGDFLNTGVQGTNDPFNEFYTSNTINYLTSVDLRIMDVLGYDVNPSFVASGVAPASASAAAASGSSTGDPAVLANYIASSFATPPGPAATASADIQPSADPLVSKPLA